MKSNAVKMSCKQGFTLIELLVVVLIIGILAAVALPQYNKAVKKAQGREVLVAIDALDKALADYYLEHDTYTGVSPDTLSVQIPDLKHFTYGEPSDSSSGIFAVKGFTSITTKACTVTFRFPNASRFDFNRIVLEWEKGKRKPEIKQLPDFACAYFNGNLQQIGTEGTKCFVEF